MSRPEPVSQVNPSDVNFDVDREDYRKWKEQQQQQRYQEAAQQEACAEEARDTRAAQRAYAYQTRRAKRAFKKAAGAALAVGVVAALATWVLVANTDVMSEK